MDFRILGPLEVYGGDGLVPLVAAKPRALLAMLPVAHPHQAQRRDRAARRRARKAQDPDIERRAERARGRQEERRRGSDD